MHNNEHFRLIIVLPVHPAGDVHDMATQLVIKYTRRSIRKLMKSLAGLFPDKNVNDFISFHALRKQEFLGGIPISEMVYVHSKMIIVDDRRVIIGTKKEEKENEEKERNTGRRMKIHFANLPS